MTSAQKAQLRKLLLDLQRQRVAKPAVALEPTGGPEAEAGGDEDGQPLAEMLQSIASSRNQNLGAIGARLDRALAKLRETPEELGVCEECGEEILFARLRAMPYAEYCTACQGKREARRGPTRRKVTDYI